MSTETAEPLTIPEEAWKAAVRRHNGVAGTSHLLALAQAVHIAATATVAAELRRLADELDEGVKQVRDDDRGVAERSLLRSLSSRYRVRAAALDSSAPVSDTPKDPA